MPKINLVKPEDKNVANTKRNIYSTDQNADSHSIAIFNEYNTM